MPNAAVAARVASWPTRRTWLRAAVFLSSNTASAAGPPAAIVRAFASASA
ncbi:hypothetical protein [Pseudonocardia sp. T1-2H]